MLTKIKNYSTFSIRQLSLGDALLRVLLVFVVLNGIGLWMAREWMYARPLFNIDYVVAALAFLWISRTLASAMLVLLFFMECARYMIPTYFFSDASFSVLFWLRSMANWSPLIQLTGFVMTLATIIGVTLLFRRYHLALRVKAWITVWVLTVTALLVLLDTVNGTSSEFKSSRETARFEVDIVGSPMHLVLIKTFAAIRGEAARFQVLPATAAATGRYFSETLAAPAAPGSPALAVNSLLTVPNLELLPRKLVVVVFESFSVLSDDPELKHWRQPFQRVEDRYTIESGALDWVGATLRGEVRELCWQGIDGYNVTNLPAALKQLGYETTAFHGFIGGMYDRSRLYPLLGFDQTVMLEQMRQAGDVPRAGIFFNGATDEYVAKLVHQDILRPGKRLTYWLTLTSHVPVNYQLARQLATPEELAAANGQSELVWGYTVICRKTLESIAEIAADPALEDCDFVIVGDHNLPVTSAELKEHFLPHKVAYLILRHKK